jgi:hypothetical protein
MLRDCPALANAKTKDGVTPLMRAANKGHVKVCEILLSAGCPVNAKDSVNGWTALMQATHQRRYEVAKLLGNHGAAVNLRGKSGSTAFDIANMLGDIEMIRIVANISVERIRKTSAPPPSTTPKSDLPSLQVSTTPPNNSSATPTTSTPTPESPTTPGGAPVQKKHSVPLCPPRLKSLTPTSNKMPLDTSELIRKLKMAYADPVTPPAIPSTKAMVSSSAQDTPGALPRFPGSRLRSNQKPRPGSIPSSSLNSSSDTYCSVSPGTSISSAHLDSSSQSRGDRPLTPEPPRSASYLTPDRPSVGVGGRGGAARFLSRSNPPPTQRVSGGKRSGGGRGGGRGGISIPPLRITANRHSLISLEAADTTKIAGQVPLLRGGTGREDLPLFLQKFEPSASRIPPVISVAGGRSKDIVPQSWRVPGGQRSLEAEKLKLQEAPTTRRRSFTVPAKVPPKSRPALQIALEQSLLGEYYNVFAEQELDLCSFLTLSESDLVDLHITNSNDRQRLLSLIQRLRNRNRTDPLSEQNRASSNGATSTPTPVFLFQ